MEEKKTLVLRSVIGIAILVLAATVSEVALAEADNNKNTYIVQMERLNNMKEILGVDDVNSYFESSMKNVSSEELMYLYTAAFHGFAASLTIQEAEKLREQQQVISVTRELMYYPLTTRVPRFLGLDQHLDRLPTTKKSSNIIIAVLDTGVWPESPSFNDTGLPPVRKNFYGGCQQRPNFKKSACNRKLVGAKFFSKSYAASLGGSKINAHSESISPRDDDGHGTHTSTTAAGSTVDGASLFGYAEGTARGMAVSARVATYKVCWKSGCYGADILAAMNEAIKDNVDVMSLSLGGGVAPYDMDTVAIGAFKAMEKGILVSCSAGNAGPARSSLSNVAPWITTVGAGTLDRDFPANVTLGNGKSYYGVSLYQNRSDGGKTYPLVSAENAKNKSATAEAANLCMPGTLDRNKVKGKIVLCERGINPRVEKGSVVKEAGGVGMILANTDATGEELVADAHLCPAAAVGEKAGTEIKKYLEVFNPNPTATIYFEGTKLGVQPAPVVAAFSSRGPNIISPEILKPDLIAPGVNILAGWAGNVSPTGLEVDKRRVPYNILSGTSMSCPVISGLAAVVKAKHPKWSPAAIRSALMTTAYTEYENGKPLIDIATGMKSTAFAHGAGQVNPIAALNPGLVYDLNMQDYFNFLCASGYTAAQIRTISEKNFTCPPVEGNCVNFFNYPSFAVSILPETKNVTVVEHTRKLTNVGKPGRYKVKVVGQNRLLKISVVPSTLTFTKKYEVLSYKVTFTVQPNPNAMKPNAMPAETFGKIIWLDNRKHVVASSFAVSWTKPAI